MGSDLKHHKIVEDRLSNLPTSLISQILSSLPTKYAVRTSSLSTFWYHQWTSITQLSFNDALAPEATSPETKFRFLAFVYRVLVHIKVASLDVLKLNCSQDYEVTHVNSWVSSALSRHVQHIDLSFSTVGPGFLPRTLYSNRHLVVLKLGTGFLLNVPMSISLDSLKILHLSVKFSDNDSLSRLVSSWPVLEELKVRGVIGDNVNTIQISSGLLKRLILICLNPFSERTFLSYKVMLNTPGLQYLEYLDCSLPYSYSEEILDCLDIARIDVVLRYNQLQSIHDLERVRCYVAAFAERISCTKFLRLSKNACEAFCLIRSEWPKFPRLIELELCIADGGSLTAFLGSSPKLETLSFEYIHVPAIWPMFPPTSVPSCMSNLKKIEVKNFIGGEDELAVVRYFLENSNCLNKMSISYSFHITEAEEAEISKKLLMLPSRGVNDSTCTVIQVEPLVIDLDKSQVKPSHAFYQVEPSRIDLTRLESRFAKAIFFMKKI